MRRRFPSPRTVVFVLYSVQAYTTGYHSTGVHKWLSQYSTIFHNCSDTTHERSHLEHEAHNVIADVSLPRQLLGVVGAEAY